MTRHFTEIWDYIRMDPKRFIGLSGLVISVLWFLFGDFGLMTRISMEREHRALEEQQSEIQKKIFADRETIRHAYHPDSIEKVARERFNFRKEGETEFIIRR
jgi:hypothetical protein